jgi:catechol 2,3-dioxygenase-like lactoylglutathione lyase family enzyme
MGLILDFTICRRLLSLMGCAFMSSFSLVSIDHVQLAMPAGEESRARAFYRDLLGMTEIPKPHPLAVRGGAWFTAGNVVFHLGVEADFRPARKAHPAIRVRGYEALLSKLRSANFQVKEDFELENIRRAHIDDPFGNRIELIAD